MSKLRATQAAVERSSSNRLADGYNVPRPSPPPQSCSSSGIVRQRLSFASASSKKSTTQKGNVPSNLNSWRNCDIQRGSSSSKQHVVVEILAGARFRDRSNGRVSDIMFVTPRVQRQLPPPKSSSARALETLPFPFLKKPSTGSQGLSKLRNTEPQLRPSASSPTEMVIRVSKEGGLNPVTVGQTGALAQLKQYNTGKFRDDLRGIIGIPEPDANISVDKLLAKWAEKISLAEQEFEMEELVFQKARARLSTPTRSTNTLRSLSPSPSAKLLEKARKIVGNSEKMFPI